MKRALSYCHINKNDPFWTPRLLTNARHSIFHQWEQLEASGCIENFRIAAGEKEGLREGWFFADSDAYKWLDAAARIYGTWPGQEDEEAYTRLKSLMDDFIALLTRAQAEDGYIFTYNQIHFPNSRWENTMIEHELYCHGHLIEAGVSHYLATREETVLKVAWKAADRIQLDFMDASPEMTSGHEEIESALLQLYEVTRAEAQLELARALLERRGRAKPFAPIVLRQNGNVAERSKIVRQRRSEYLAAHPNFKPYQVPPGNYAQKTSTVQARWMLSALTGKYFQMHKPVREQTVPVGHSVRFAYLETALARLATLTGDQSLLPALEKAWEHMVARRMYVTGGIGSLPALEGFGRDYELDPELAYAETCAALGSIFWNWEMAKATGKAKYSDLLEWQLYNAASVGMGADGDTYFYNNPLCCHSGVERRPWFAVPCCPSNLSRTWASLGDYIYSVKPGELTVHQYFGSNLFNLLMPLANGQTAGVYIDMQSGLPWHGTAELKIKAFQAHSKEKPPFVIKFRLPSWAEETFITYDSKREHAEYLRLEIASEIEPAASGYQPHEAAFTSSTDIQTWGLDEKITVAFKMPITLRRASSKVRGHRGKVAVTRGPLVYCLESVDNQDVDIFTARLDPGSLEHEYRENLLGGAVVITGKTLAGQPLTFIPYFLWGNRGPSQMTVWVNTGSN